MEWIFVHPEPKNDTEAGLVREAPSKKGGKNWKRRRQRKREESSLQSLSLFLEFFTSPRSLLSEGPEQASVRKRPTFRNVTTGFPRNDVWETNAEIPFWWRDSTKIWVVLLIGWKFSSTNQKHYPDLGSDASSVWNFCTRFSNVISRGNQWWVVSRNVGCFLKTEPKSPFFCERKRPILRLRVVSLFLCLSRLAPSVTRVGHLRVSGVLLDGPRIKRDLLVVYPILYGFLQWT